MRTLYSLVAIGGFALLLSTDASAIELVRNGTFESGPQFNADFWRLPNLGTNPSGEPNNYARVGNFANFIGNDPNGFAFGPHPAGQGTGTQIPTRIVWMGGLSPRTSIIEQDIDTAAYITSGSTKAILTFKLVTEDLGVAGLDFFHLDFGGTRLKTVDVGASYVDFGPFKVQGGNHFWTREDVVLDLTPYMDGTVKTLTFTMLDGMRTNSTSGSNAFVDNVSIQAVPEPVTVAALGLGLAALVRRRKR